MILGHSLFKKNLIELLFKSKFLQPTKLFTI